nr:MAG TPA: Toxin Ibs, type I toxin-antitoxin system [Caudoviricetes sp.]
MAASGACRIERRLEEMAKVILFLFLLLVCAPAY